MRKDSARKLAVARALFLFIWRWTRASAFPASASRKELRKICWLAYTQSTNLGEPVTTIDWFYIASTTSAAPLLRA